MRRLQPRAYCKWLVWLVQLREYYKSPIRLGGASTLCHAFSNRNRRKNTSAWGSVLYGINPCGGCKAALSLQRSRFMNGRMEVSPIGG